jgi:hypothetical protein
MIPRTTRRAAAFVGVCCVIWGTHLLAAPGALRSAQADVTQTSPLDCEVRLTLTVDGAAEIEHRLATFAGSVVTLLESPPAEAPRDVGRTRALIVRPAPGTYALHYRVRQPPEGAFRCPLWLPTAPADGRSRAVQLVVTIPDGAEPAGTMPAFTWTGRRGTATIAHLPAIAIVRFASPGEARPWDIARVMDLTAMATLAAGTVWWLGRSRRSRAIAARRSGTEAP